jgi:nickel-dependent lactate racemase
MDTQKLTGQGSPDKRLTGKEIRRLIAAGTPTDLYRDKKVLVLTPDATRTCPLPLMICCLNEVCGRVCRQLDFMVALGTHPPLSAEKILALYGLRPEEKKARFPNSAFYNHRWDLPETFTALGTISAEEIAALSQGHLREDVPVVINRRIFDYDLVVILGPVFPHEVVGFSGGAKYLFPGISGGEFLHFFHWLGAVLTCAGIIGRKDTPVREVIHRALEMVPVPVHCLAMVVTPANDLCGLYVGGAREAWTAAADLSARIHIVRKAAPFKIVLGRAPAMYDELWVAGKVMYKLEQVVADGGRLIIYGPHITTISRTWGAQIEKIGYHVRDYFLKQMAAFRDVPRGVLAHSTHVRGTGAFENGVERPRIEVVLATAIPEDVCRRVNLGYLDPAGIDPADYRDREAEGLLFVDHAGEMLYQLNQGKTT